MTTINLFIKDLSIWLDQVDTFEGEVELNDEEKHSLTVRFTPQTAEIISRKRWYLGKWREVKLIDINEDLFLNVFSLLLSERKKNYDADAQEKRREEEQSKCIEFEKQSSSWGPTSY